MRCLVTGGTGALGGDVVAALRGRGHDVAVLSRRDAGPTSGAAVIQGDLRTGTGLDAALAGVGTVVHLASDPKRPTAVDVEGTRTLLTAAAAAGVGHLVFISIVGIDRIPFRYYRAKRAAEELITVSAVPSTILRATQFHPFAATLCGPLSRLPVGVAPRGWRLQPVDVGVVATELADAVDGGPAGRLPDLAGPEVLTVADIVAALRRAGGRSPRTVTVPVPGGFSAAWRVGAATAAPTPGRSFGQWLADRDAPAAR